MSKLGYVFVIAGPSGTGKSSLCQQLEQDGYGKFSVSATTREPSEQEVDGKDYFFVNKAEFERMLNDGGLLEWATVHGKLYGTPKNWIVQQLAQGNDVLLEIDIAGAKQVRKTLDRVVTFFILPPDIASLKKRLCARNRENEDQIRTRLTNACQEILHIGDFDYALVNDVFLKVYEQIVAIITSYRRGEQHQAALNKFLVSSQQELVKHWYTIYRNGLK